MTTFAELGFSKPTLSALTECGYTIPTDIQDKTIGLTMSGQDIMASAETGSGKTAAYALPIIECLDEPEHHPRALILLPTRELALQVQEQFEKFAKYRKLRSVTIYGGVGYEKQKAGLKTADIIVATPGRMLDYLERKTVSLAGIEMLVLDEADRLLDMGFMPQVRRIVKTLSKERQTLMFSATIDGKVEMLAREFLRNPVTVRVNSNQIEPKEIEQKMFRVHEFSKDELLAKLIRDLSTSVIVFTQTKRKATWVMDRLRDAKIPAEEIHGDITQSQREKTLSRYRKGAFKVLVATDIAARGLDIPDISHVINYDLPDSPEDYVHRIGRTGRAGRSGIAYSFVSDEQIFLMRDIEKVIGRKLELEGAKQPATPVRSLRPAKRRAAW
ncbi:DEAD/DEAH box helicase [Candidatus Obscuribacterales bacterium]|nr:DEAD/DEAH box helicase [Candidatus Obscuribacterales bacterium]MBX3136400.1 DEAD/DEAH box helicase [Candidatus Obscuribacterales bacterium]MBX3150744.1 DEAD/DEAH box helicase [Candidatus Obscuribacterales bacterium]